MMEMAHAGYRERLLRANSLRPFFGGMTDASSREPWITSIRVHSLR
jgi:hypothetical protein